MRTHKAVYNTSQAFHSGTNENAIKAVQPRCHQRKREDKVAFIRIQAVQMLPGFTSEDSTKATNVTSATIHRRI